ncbi:MAG TPA: LITAF-like zinc ribbon domain-containing protein [Pyrinomonadaceae bacterium]|nr:LITAF-like zinc ribbon domain-containing protein [Pyrinomonadaceae bacterium]
MIKCDTCGRENADQTQFCRFCGARLPVAQAFAQQRPTFNDPTYAPPRPYAWKTDEYQTQTDARARPDNVHSFAGHAQQDYAQPLAHAPFAYMGANYRCPNCGTTTLPITERRISTAGWITFALLLVFTVIFFWIGLLMKQNVSVCPVCRATLGQ